MVSMSSQIASFSKSYTSAILRLEATSRCARGRRTASYAVKTFSSSLPSVMAAKRCDITIASSTAMPAPAP